MIIDTDRFVQVYSNCFDDVVLKETIKELRSLKTLKIPSESVSNTHWEPHSWYNPEKKEIVIWLMI